MNVVFFEGQKHMDWGSVHMRKLYIAGGALFPDLGYKICLHHSYKICLHCDNLSSCTHD